MADEYVTKSIPEVLGMFPKGTPAREAADRTRPWSSEIGELIPLSGYDVMATATTDEGKLMVLTNGSTHFLVVFNHENEDGVASDMALLMAQYPYGAYPRRAYLAALGSMADKAVRMVPSIPEVL